MENITETKRKLISALPTEMGDLRHIREISMMNKSRSNMQVSQDDNTNNDKNLEKVYSSHRNRSLKEVRVQREKVSEWYEEDKKYLNTIISLKEIDKFVCGDLEVLEINNEKRIKQVSGWKEIRCKNNYTEENDNNLQENLVSNNSSHQNIILKNKIIKVDNPGFNLRSLGVELEINFLMAGESCLYIFSRGKNEITNDMAVCCINKELDSSRKFINFAILEESSIDDSVFVLKTLKKQEIPKQENYIKNLDICEVRLTFVDNGDNKCLVFIENDTTQKQFIFIADFYVPNIEISNMMLGASGDLISLRSLKMKQIHRNSKLINKNDENKTAQSCTCCSIF